MNRTGRSPSEASSPVRALGVPRRQETLTGLFRRVAAPSPGFFFPLRWKVALSFSLLLVLVAGMVAWAFIGYERKFLIHEGEKRVRALAESLAANARNPVLAADELALAPVTASVMLDEDVRYAYVVDHRGIVIYHSDSSAIGMALPGEIPPAHPWILQAEVPIVVEGTRVGTVVVGLSDRYVRRALRSTALGALGPLAAGTLIGVLGIFVLTGLHVSRIERMGDAVRALGEGDLKVRVQVDSSDEVGRLARSFNQMVEQLLEARSSIELHFTETISALAAAVEAKDAYTRGHCDRVGMICKAIAERIGVPGDDLRDLGLAAILHDVGKIGVEGGVIGKLGRLTGKEIGNMRQHPEIGARILSSLSSLGQVGAYVRHHHENYDGSGYPDGLAGDEIPLASRIINLVDAYDAMTSNRPYRTAMPHDEALARIRAGSGVQFDPAIVDVFLRLESEGVIVSICRGVEGGELR